ncbi:MAG TPA: hypothetical protein VMV16_08725 [Solirubrobacteraceae bacterium]|nr:hypothetical protein [Solirubrobacteraceae bacterium]
MRYRVWAWMTSRDGAGIENLRILVPLAIFLILAVWFVGTVAGELHTIARSL